MAAGERAESGREPIPGEVTEEADGSEVVSENESSASSIAPTVDSAPESALDQTRNAIARRLRSTVRSLHYRNFRLYVAGMGVSLIGTWMERVAMSWLVYRLTDSALILGIVGFASRIPTLIAGPFAGVLADRFDRRRILYLTQSFSMVQAFILAVLEIGRAHV